MGDIRQIRDRLADPHHAHVALFGDRPVPAPVRLVMVENGTDESQRQAPAIEHRGRNVGVRESEVRGFERVKLQLADALHPLDDGPVAVRKRRSERQDAGFLQQSQDEGCL